MKTVRPWVCAGLVLASMSFAADGRGASAVERLERGVYQEETAGNLAEAIQVYAGLVKEEQINRPVAAEALYRLGRCWRKQGDSARARQAFEDLLSRFSDQTKYVEAARKELASLPQAPRATPGPEAKAQAARLSARAWQLWMGRQLAEAETEFRKSVELDPTNANAWNGLGWSLSNQGNGTEAARAFEQVLRLEPKHAAALNGLGWIAFAAGRADEAISWWEKAVAASPDATAAWSGLVRVHTDRKQFDKAIQAAQQWLKAEPGSQDAQQALKRAQALQSGAPEAAALPADGKYTPEKIRATDAAALFRHLGRAPEPGYHQFAAMWALTEKAQTGTAADKEEILRRAAEHLDESRTTDAARWHASYVLSGMGDPRGIPALARVLREDKSATDRGVAACALGSFSQPEARSALEAARGTEKDPEVGKWIGKALAGEFRKASGTASSAAPPAAASGAASAQVSSDSRLLPVIEQRMKQLEGLVAGGNTTWLDKKDIADVYEDWAKTGPTPDEKKAEIEAIRSYLARHTTNPLYGWRLNHLLASAELDSNRPDEAAKYLDAALQAYPDTKYPEPSKQSKYQHIINQRALLLWQQQGPEAAEKFLVTRLAADPRFEYFFPGPWEQEYRKRGIPERYPALLQQIKGAYETRKKTFPDQASSIDRYAQVLR